MAFDADHPVIEFDLKVPCTDDQVQANIASAMKRGLASTQGRKTLTVLANGPSAKYAPLDGQTLALNGALKQFTDKGLAPTYWAACDPQALVADFLREAPESTTYLVASKCHPAVFEALQGRKVVLWHIADQAVPGRVRAPLTPSVTMSAIWEMRLAFGFTDFEVWGWDAAFLDGEHHAGEAQANMAARDDFVQANIGGEVLDGKIHGGRDFDTTHTWAAEVQFAETLLQVADLLDVRLVINGGGMVAAMQAHLPRAA